MVFNLNCAQRKDLKRKFYREHVKWRPRYMIDNAIENAQNSNEDCLILLSALLDPKGLLRGITV